MTDEDWVVEATREALARLLRHAEKVGLANTEEFTFRSFFMSAAHDLLGGPRFQTEWKKFDLLVQDGDVATLIEFKYYLLRRTVHLDGTPGRAKGGASLQNEKEFGACLAKLRNAAFAGISDHRLVLAYERDDKYSDRRLHTYHRSYGDLSRTAVDARVWAWCEGPLAARILQPTSGSRAG